MRRRPARLFVGPVKLLPAPGPWVAALGALVLVAGCSSSGAEEGSTEEADAQSLVSAAHSAGVAPDLTVGVAESLYGSSAAQICDVLDGGISSAEALLLSGNPSGRRDKLITTDAVTYERLVVTTYCPDQLDAYDDLVADIDTTDTTS
jgi:hypothetical protein